MICIINCGTSCLEEIKLNVTAFNHSYKVINVDQIKYFNFKPFSAIIISGGPILLTKSDIQKYIDIFNFIKTINVPIFGICLGHQIIGLVYNSEIKLGKMIDKKEKICIVNQNEFFKDIENHSRFREEHSEFISLPNEFTLLAKSESCQNEAMKHKNKKIYSTQFHPEVSSNNGKKLFENFFRIINSK